MEVTHNVVGWFEIPVSDMDRALKFYETILGYTLQREKMGSLDMAWFPWKENEVGSSGSLVYDPELQKKVYWSTLQHSQVTWSMNFQK